MYFPLNFIIFSIFYFITITLIIKATTIINIIIMVVVVIIIIIIFAFLKYLIVIIIRFVCFIIIAEVFLAIDFVSFVNHFRVHHYVNFKDYEGLNVIKVLFDFIKVKLINFLRIRAFKFNLLIIQFNFFILQIIAYN